VIVGYATDDSAVVRGTDDEPHRAGTERAGGAHADRTAADDAAEYRPIDVDRGGSR
jgi:hypothetical protein